MPRTFFAACLALSFTAGASAHAQSTPPSLLRLKPDQLIRVESHEHSIWQGRYYTVSKDSLLLRADSTRISTIATESIYRVHERTTQSKTGALIGCAVGLTFGAMGGAGWAKSDSFIGPESESEGAVLGAFAGILVGTGVGALIGSAIPHWRLRYEAPSRKGT